MIQEKYQSSSESSMTTNTNISQATSLSPPEGLEEITLTIDEKDNSNDDNTRRCYSRRLRFTNFCGRYKASAEKEIKEIQAEAEGEIMKLKQPQEVYIEIYRTAKKRKIETSSNGSLFEVKQ